MDKLKGLQPERVMYYFEAISCIPRESANEQAVSDYIKSVGEKLGFETIQDANNPEYSSSRWLFSGIFCSISGAVSV